MAVVPLTLTISLCLVFTFVVFFLSEHARGRLGSAERDSLLPLADETPRVAAASRAALIPATGESEADGAPGRGRRDRLA